MARTPSHAVYRSSQPREHKGIRNVPLPFEGHTPRGLPSIDRLTRMRGHAHCLPVPRSAVHHIRSILSTASAGLDLLSSYVQRYSAYLRRTPKTHTSPFRVVSFLLVYCAAARVMAVAHRANSVFTGDINIDCCGWDCLLA